MSGQRHDWWNEESRSDALLRQVAGKAEKLGRLPTKDEIQADPDLLSLANIAAIYEERSVEVMLAKLARLLYKRGTKPVDLSAAELALSPTERAQKEREYLEFYRTRLAKVKEPGGIKQIRKEQEAAWEAKRLPEGAVIRRIPLKTPEERRRERQALSEKQKRGAWNSLGLESPEAAERRAAWAAGRKTDETSDKDIEKVVKEVVKKIADEVVIAAVLQLKEHFGGFPSQGQINRYNQEHTDAKVPSWPAIVRVLGPDRTAWQARIDARKADAMSDGASTSVAAVAPAPVAKANEAIAEVESEAAQRLEPTKLCLKMRLPTLTVDVRVNGRAYQVQVEFDTAQTTGAN